MPEKLPTDGRWTIIFDGDDTLWECGIYYRAAEAACLKILHEDWPTCPWSTKAIVELERRVQRAMLRRHGFFLTIFEDGWEEAYRQLAHRAGHPVSTSTVLGLRWAAGSIHQAPYPCFPGTIELLDSLRAAGHTLHLLTLGEYEFQWSKIRRNDLERHFTKVHVVQHGKQLIMRLLGSNGQPAVMVGDSLPSDITPAQRLGLATGSVFGQPLRSRCQSGFRKNSNLNSVFILKRTRGSSSTAVQTRWLTLTGLARR